MLAAYESTEWYIPGPVDVRPEVLAIMSEQPYGHRTDEIKPFIQSIRRDLFAIVGASEDEHSMVLTGGSGTNALEMAARSWGARTGVEGDAAPDVLVTSIGYFGDLWEEIFEKNDIPTDNLRVEEGDIILPSKLASKIYDDRDRPYDIVTVTHNDTSTGTFNPLRGIADVVKDSGGLLFVDAVSSAGGTDIDMSENGIDFLAMAPQKCFGATPGLSLAVVRNDALEYIATRNRGFTTDVMQQIQANSEDMTLTTPPEAQIGALALQLDYIANEETPKARYERHATMMHMAHRWAQDEGFELLPQTHSASKTVSCFVNTRGISLEGLRQRLWATYPVRYGYDSGHPKLAKIRKGQGLPDTFRIPHMGDRQPESLAKYLEVVSDFMK